MMMSWKFLCVLVLTLELFDVSTSLSCNVLRKRHALQNKLRMSIVENLEPSPLLSSNLHLHQLPFLVSAEEAQTGFSSLSLYFTLALYVMTLPGLYSLISRSVKIKPVQKVYDLPGPANPTAKPLRQVAAEVLAYFKALNYEVTAAEDVITFKGVMGRSNSQAYFLTFCTFVGLGSLGLVLSVLFPDVGAKAYAITLLSPYAGLYYWNNAQSENQVKVKMETSDDEETVSITAEGGKEDLERFSQRLALTERGKVYVRGLFDSSEEKIDVSVGSGAVVAINSDDQPVV
mmetsp:Transcript_29954/g.41159  ORF Transcript_29954/g.41159 Transcript_29954/m.41159 type:complete len:288 (-) Transcript_29954:58-921(-)